MTESSSIRSNPRPAASSAAGPRTCLVTGGTGGIGRATVIQLAAQGDHVLFTGRNAPRGEALAANLARRHPAQTIRFLAADLSSLDSVRRLARAVAEQAPRLDALINNAGARFDSYQESADGFELSFATNHLGHFLLTAQLLDRLLVAPAARIVTLSSRRHRFVKSTQPWLAPRPNYDPWEVYSRAKLANTLFALELARRLRDTAVVSNAVDPGIVASGFSRNNGWLPWIKHIVWAVQHRQLVSCAHAAQTVVFAATHGAVAGQSGKYYHEHQETTPAPAALDPALAADLWRRSVDWTGLNRENCRAWFKIAP